MIGTAHRGRLNILAHNLGRPYDTIFAEFEGTSTLEPITTIPQGGTGDVKYHHGAQGSYQLPGGESIIVRLESNPSHLEFVAPVAAGATRAAQTTRQGPHAHRDTDAAIPVILHGDAAFPGQGVVAETLNLQALDGYTVGGTIHIIQNNQVGFTTDPDDSRSTTWASDLAKGYDVPIIHVNADDVAACVGAVRLAFAFRQEFGHDVLIDLIGYRRFGHNEADEPAYTQPEMYQVIKKHPPVRELFARQLIDHGRGLRAGVDRDDRQVWDVLAERPPGAQGADRRRQGRSSTPPASTSSTAPRRRRSRPRSRSIGCNVLNEELLAVPDGFTVHPKLVKQLEQRRDAMGPAAASPRGAGGGDAIDPFAALHDADREGAVLRGHAVDLIAPRHLADRRAAGERLAPAGSACRRLPGLSAADCVAAGDDAVVGAAGLGRQADHCCARLLKVPHRGRDLHRRNSPVIGRSGSRAPYGAVPEGEDLGQASTMEGLASPSPSANSAMVPASRSFRPPLASRRVSRRKVTRGVPRKR